jgi:hypothetical protein
LEPLDVTIGETLGAAFFAGENGGYASSRLEPVDALLSMSWVAAPKLANYSERISLTFDDVTFELRFPSPYLSHQPTELVEQRSDGPAHRTINHRPSYAEAFVEELVSWHDAIVGGSPIVNTVEEAAMDIRLLAQFARLAVGSPQSLAAE